MKINVITVAKILTAIAVGGSTALVAIACEKNNNSNNSKLKGVNRTLSKCEKRERSEATEQNTSDDPLEVIQSWEKTSDDDSDEIEEEPEEEVSDDNVEDESENESIEEFLDRTIPEEGLMTYQPVEDPDSDFDYENFDFRIPGSPKIKGINGNVFDFDDIAEYVKEAKEFYQKVLSGELDMIEGFNVVSQKEVDATLPNDEVPEPKDGMSVMEYCVMIDPFDLTNRKTNFGPNAPGKDPYQKPLREFVEETVEPEDVDDEDDEDDTLPEKVDTVVRKLFNNKDTNHMYSGYIVNCRTALDNGYEEIYPVMEKFETLVKQCYDAITARGNINRRTCINRFSNVFRKADQIIKLKTAETASDNK